MSSVEKTEENTHILSIDIGGTSIKACILTEKGDLFSEYTKLSTPKNANPQAVINVIRELVTPLAPYSKIAIGFPGYVKCGIVETAPNLAKNKWAGFPLAQHISDLLGKPVRLINDADQQALGIIGGKGFEIVLTLGTGFGTSLTFDGELLPHLELAHLPVTKNKDYDAYIGDKAFIKEGKKNWNERVQRVIQIYKTVFNYDELYLGGGNAKQIDFELDHNIHLVSNRDGIKGGAKLWAAKEKYHVFTTYPKLNLSNGK
jgi:polyphosphate glucokinase